MGILDGFENFLEGVIEGLFKNCRKGSLQPIEIGKRLIKTMEAHKKISLANTYVPNKYSVFLHPDSFSELKSLQHTFAGELKEVLYERTEKDNLSFIGGLIIEFLEEPKINPGTINIEAEFVESEPFVNKLDGFFKTQEYPSLGGNFSKSAFLIYNGDQVFTLADEQYSIGRDKNCDIVIDDINVSRIHAWLKQEKQQWWLKDNNSTNGTFINDQAINNQRLNHEDVIRLGTATLIFKKD